MRAASLAALVVLLVATLGADRGHAAPAPVQHGAQPNPQEVRPGTAQGDTPSASAGRLVHEDKARRILGLPVETLLFLGAILLVLVVVGGILAAGARRSRGGAQ